LVYHYRDDLILDDQNLFLVHRDDHFAVYLILVCHYRDDLILENFRVILSLNYSCGVH
jgi:hypothetical protein